MFPTHAVVIPVCGNLRAVIIGDWWNVGELKIGQRYRRSIVFELQIATSSHSGVIEPRPRATFERPTWHPGKS